MTLQLLGLSDGTEPERDPVLMRGAYFSFLCLRHLHIRELQVQARWHPRLLALEIA